MLLLMLQKMIRCFFIFAPLIAISALLGSAFAQIRIITDDTAHTYVCANRRLPRILFGAEIDRNARKKPVAAIAEALDSLGYFHSRWDTLRDTIRISEGARAAIASIAIQSDPTVPIDSVRPIRLPMPYDAGTISSLAQKAAVFFAQRGYPFAAATTTVEELPPADGASPRMSVRFAINKDALCRFGPPLFVGPRKTVPRVLMHDMRCREGTAFDERKVGQSEANLLSRPYISSVQTGDPRLVRNPADTVVRAGNAETVVVPFSVTDRSGLGFDGALSYQSQIESGNRLSGNVNFSLLNIYGRGESALFAYRGEKGFSLLDAQVAVPWILNSPLSGSARIGLEIRQGSYNTAGGELRALADVRPLWQAGAALVGRESTVDTVAGDGEVMASSKYYGTDLLFVRRPERLEAGRFSREFLLRTGAGLAENGSRLYNRIHISSTFGVHLPFRKHQAMRLRLVASSLFTQETWVPEVELYRVGGASSLRGYSENQFPFRTVAYGQSELLHYFSSQGAIYIFGDGGVGFRSMVLRDPADRTVLFGYGAGIRLPSKIGSISLEWARNINDTRSFGRIHLRVWNSLAVAEAW
jgi:outer membrane protein assembly factor BamA